MGVDSNILLSANEFEIVTGYDIFGRNKYKITIK